MYRNEQIVSGKVQGITEYGVFVKLEEDYTGLVHISEISDGFVSNVGDYFKIGDEIYARILNIDNNKKQMKLSVKNINYKTGNNKESFKIIETNSGFATLSKKLNFWIKDYLKNKKINKYY